MNQPVVLKTRAVFALRLTLSLIAAPTAVWADDHVGAGRCNDCHRAQYEQWRTSAHARTMERLDPAQRRDPRCLGCHATSPSGGLLGVQCESCHGAGRHYAHDPVMRDRELARAVGLSSGAEPAVCARCHTADSARLIPFDYARALSKVQHGVGGTEPRAPVSAQVSP